MQVQVQAQVQAQAQPITPPSRSNLVPHRVHVAALDASKAQPIRAPGGAGHRATLVFGTLVGLALVAGAFAARASAQATQDPPGSIGMDSLRTMSAEARVLGDSTRAWTLRAEMLRRRPGDGFALREMALDWRDQFLHQALPGRIDTDAEIDAALARAYRPGGAGPAPALDTADRAFLRGLSLYYSNRLRTASAAFDRAIGSRPGWTWARLYKARALDEAARPESEWRGDFQAALDDPDTSPAALEYLARQQSETISREGLAETLAALDRVPARWCNGDEGIRAAERIRGTVRTCHDLRRLWETLEGRMGPMAIELIGTVRSSASSCLPPDSLRAFLEERARTGPYGSHWRRELRTWLCGGGRSASCDAMPSEGDVGPTSRALFLDQAYDLPAEDLLRLSDQMLEGYLDYTSCHGRAQFLEELGRPVEAAAVRESLRVQSPAQWHISRLDSRFQNDPPGARALLDSLRATGCSFHHFEWYETLIGEAVNDTLTIEALQKLGPPSSTTHRMAVLAGVAVHRSPSRAARLLRGAVALAPNDYGVVERALSIAADMNDRSLALELTHRAEALRPRGVVQWAVQTYLRAGRTDEAMLHARRALIDPDTRLETLLGLAESFQAYGQPAFADSLMERATQFGDELRRVRHTGAWLALQRRDLSAARAMIEPLAAEFPGRQGYRSLLLEVGKADSLMQKTPAATLDQAFGRFQHDLTSTDWILARKVRPDSLTSAGGVVLERRHSIVAEATRMTERQRQTWQVLTQEGLQASRVYRYGFNPDDGVPEIRVARVIRNDGSVAEVPREAITITADASAEADVSNHRLLNIPFYSLEIGAVIDLAIDARVSQSPQGWSFRHAFAWDAACRNEILEVLVPNGLTAGLRASPGLQMKEIPVDGGVIHRVEVRDHSPTPGEELAPSPFHDFPWFGITTCPSWAAAGEFAQESFWAKEPPTPEIRELSARILRGVKGRDASVNAILAWMQSNIHYLAVELGQRRTVPATAGEVLTRGSGDCKDMVTLMISLLDAAGLAAEPVIVAPRPEADPIGDFPTPGMFTHMIARVPGQGGQIFVDPTERQGCFAPLAPWLLGITGLALPRQGPATLVSLPVTSPDDHGFVMSADVIPMPDKAEIRVRGDFRGALARKLRADLSQSDTAAVSATVNRVLGWGAWEGCKRISWALERDGCTGVTLSGVWADTVWAQRPNTFRLSYRSEAADPFLAYPDPEGRKRPFLLEHPFHCVFTLRMHEGNGWEITRDVAPVQVRGNGYSGTVSGREFRDGSQTGLEIKHEFEASRILFSAEEYKTFRADWLRFQFGVYQRFPYRRTFEADAVRRAEDYIGQHPEDTSFALNAAQQVLGSDMGGDGAQGVARRDIARKWLRALIDRPGAGAEPGLLYALLEGADGHYRAADSLISHLADISPDDRHVLQGLAWIRGEMGDLDGQARAQTTLVLQHNDMGACLPLITLLHQLGRTEEARSQEERYLLMQGNSDSLAILMARFEARQEAYDCHGAEELFARARPLLDSEREQTLRYTCHMLCGRYGDALAMLDEDWRENPLDPWVCNNRAWCQALLGRDLETAEQLASYVAGLRGDASNSTNTLGAIYARRGDWDRARREFHKALAFNDKPSNILVNQYFLGLCAYAQGRKDEALRIWNSLLVLPGAESDAEWIGRVGESLERAARGKDPAGSIFVDEALTSAQPAGE